MKDFDRHKACTSGDVTFEGIHCEELEGAMSIDTVTVTSQRSLERSKRIARSRSPTMSTVDYILSGMIYILAHCVKSTPMYVRCERRRPRRPRVG